MKIGLPLAAACAAALAAPVRLERHEIASTGAERIRGAAFEEGRLYTWGDRILRWDLRTRSPEVLRGPGAALGEGGAAADFDGDGRLDLILTETAGARALVWFQGPLWTRRVIDQGVDTPDVVFAAIHGRRGVLVVHRGMQVRFYERASERDLYSFYSPSLQSGMLLADIDGDGRPDILCGNYWMQNPPEFSLSWRLFAIRTWSEEKLSARSALAWWGGRLAVAQSELPAARLAWFRKPDDPRQLWEEHRLEGSLRLDQPHSLAAADFDGDGRLELLVAERAGRGRLLLFREDGTSSEAARSTGILWMRVLESAGGPEVLAVDRRGIAWWRVAR